MQDVSKQGKRCILDIDSQVRPTVFFASCLIQPQGVRSLKSVSSLHPFYLFVAPPSITILTSRLKGRGTETDESVASRLQAAVAEINYAKEEGIYDAVVVNDDLERAYEVLKKIALGECSTGDQMPVLEI